MSEIPSIEDLFYSQKCLENATKLNNDINNLYERVDILYEKAKEYQTLKDSKGYDKSIEQAQKTLSLISRLNKKVSKENLEVKKLLGEK